MHAIVCEAFGPINQLKLQEVPDPVLKSSDVIIDVGAASVNFPDALIVQGLYQNKPPFPFSPGHELAGIISEVGADVLGFKVGDRVVAIPGIGGFAEKVMVNGSRVFPLTPKMSMEEGAALALTYGTSLHALQNIAKLQRGDTLLVLGASGGVGAAAIELGKIMGAKVIAAASTQEKLEFCKNLGADILLNYDTDDLKTVVKEATLGKGCDVVYDAVGGKYSEPAMRSLGWRGRFLVVGFAAGEIPKIPLNLALLSERSILGVFWGDWVRRNPEGHLQNMELLTGWFESKALKPVISARFDLEHTVQAIEHLASRKAMGKVVVNINPHIQ